MQKRIVKDCVGTWLVISMLVTYCLPALAEEQRVQLTGNMIQGGLVQGKTQPDAVVSLDGKPVRVSKEGVFLLGFGRDEPEQLILDVRFADATHERRELRVGRRSYDIQRIDGLPATKVTPPQRDWERIRREGALVKKARRIESDFSDFLDGFVWPLKGRISGVYGSQRILNGKPKRPHYGVDIAAPVGTPAAAPAAGVVRLAHPDMFYSGGTLIIDHGQGLTSTFIHLSRILVKEGQRVHQHQPVAEVGATGRVTGPHLDWRMNLLSTRLDPQLLVGPMPEAASTQ